MAIKFGRIDYSGTSFEEQTFNKNQLITSSSLGVNHIYGLKDQKTDPDGVLTVSGSHWAFVHNMFYMSGSTKVSQSMPADIFFYTHAWHTGHRFRRLPVVRSGLGPV